MTKHRIRYAVAEEHFLQNFVLEYTDGNFMFPVLRETYGRECVNTQHEQPVLADVYTVDVEDDRSAGTPECLQCFLRGQLEQAGEIALVTHIAKDSWEGTSGDLAGGWKDLWWLFLAPGGASKDGFWPYPY